MRVRQEVKTDQPMKAYETVADFMDGVRTVAIAGHEKPDGDCIGACMAAWLYLRETCPQLQVDVYLEEMNDVFDYLEGMDQVKHSCDPSQVYDMMILMDISSTSRIGVAGLLFANAKKTICFDHHATNSGQFDWLFNYPGTSSTCEVFSSFLDAQKVNRSVAEALFTGIVHDTGVFRYSSTSPKTHQLAANLMMRGVDAAKIIEESFYGKTYAQQQILGRVLLESQQMYDGRVISAAVSREEMQLYGVGPADMEGIVAQMRNTKGADIAVFMYELEDGRQKVSLRSREADVSRIASALGGGGHRRAAGITMNYPPFEVLAKLAPLIEQALKENDQRDH